MTYTVPLIINGLEVHTDIKLDILDPINGKLLWHSSAASAKEVNEAINAAKAAFPSWSSTNAIVKRDILLAAADIFDKKVAELSSIVKSESGCPDLWTDAVTQPAGTGLIRDVAGRITSITSTVPTMRDENAHAIVYKEPYGVVLAIAPWLVNVCAPILSFHTTKPFWIQECPILSWYQSHYFCSCDWEHGCYERLRTLSPRLLVHCVCFSRSRSA